MCWNKGLFVVIGLGLLGGCDTAPIERGEEGGGTGGLSASGSAGEEGEEGESGGEEAEEGGAEEGGSEEGGSEEGGAEEGGAEEGGSEEGGAEEGGSEEGGNEDAQHCDLWDGLWCGGGEAFEPFTCDAPSPCEELVYYDSEEFGGMLGAVNPEAGECIVQSLATGEAATHRIALNPGGQNNDSWRVESLGDGTVVVQHDSQEDKCGDRYESWSYLKPASFFQGCSALAIEEQINCIIDAAEATCVPGETVCP